jgi:hypothetical protein
MLKLQEFLLTQESPLEKLREQFGIKSNRHAKYPNLVQFKYSQIDSPMGEKIVQESRGIILDEANEWEIVARPFDKFFNYGEGHAPQIDWATARVTEKVDGSLMILYPYRGEWLVATSGTADASGQINGFPMTFHDLFWKTWKEMDLKLPTPGSLWDDGVTFMWELTSPYNRVVVPHDKPKLTLLGVRATSDGSEYPPTIFAHDGWPVVRHENPLRFQSYKDLEEHFPKVDPIRLEGFVVTDANWNRVKVKHPGYVSLHHMKDGFGIKRMVDLVRQNEGTEFLNYFPEWKEAHTRVKEEYEALVDGMTWGYEQIKDIESQKDFALKATKAPYPAALFMMRKGQVKSIREAISGMQLDRLCEILSIGKIELVSADSTSTSTTEV